MDSDDAAAGFALIGVCVVFGAVIVTGWLVYKIVEAAAKAIQGWKAEHDRLQWEQQRARRMVEAHHETMRQIDETVDYYDDLHAYVAEKVKRLPS